MITKEIDCASQGGPPPMRTIDLGDTNLIRLPLRQLVIKPNNS